jgi:hypothetical protein
MRLTASHDIAREDFLLNCSWISRVSNLPTHGWNSLVTQETEQINDIRSEINALAGEIDLEIGEIRRIASIVQMGERETSQKRKKWSRRICARSSRLQRNTQIVARNSSI